jgi:predicted dithiol-disulfide oxidoreductase (DUF899 family)
MACSAKELLAKEKRLTREREALAAENGSLANWDTKRREQK